jgi:GNAT superfamily N-acetyltransferase
MDERERQSEAIERAALLSLHEHCPAATRHALGLFCEPIEDALVAGASHDGSILLNRTLGFGTERAVTRDTARRIHGVYEGHDVARYFLHVYPDDLESEPGLFADLPLECARGWRKFHRGAEAPAPVRSELRVERVAADRSIHFGEIVAPAFGMTPAAAPLLAALSEDPRWHLLVSYEGEHPAGAGALFVLGESAWLEWGATSPEFRRRGSQGAIMAQRIRTALALGCTAMFTETGEASGDDPQHSYGNIERHGFRAGSLRENWAPPRPS